jgi:hypothetical protein
MAHSPTAQGFRALGRTSLLREDFDCIPGCVWRLLFIFERALEIHPGERIFRIKLSFWRLVDKPSPPDARRGLAATALAITAAPVAVAVEMWA